MFKCLSLMILLFNKMDFVEYINDTTFNPDYKLVNSVYMNQIRNKEIYCELNLILHHSFISKFKTYNEALTYIQLTMIYVNNILSYSFEWEKGVPMFQYIPKSITPLGPKSYLEQYIKDPETLISIFNEYAINNNYNRYCQQVLITAENWGDILGIAFQDDPNYLLYNLCNSESAFILTALMRKRIMNQATLAYLFVHEAAHTFSVEHDKNGRLMDVAKLDNSTRASKVVLKNAAVKKIISKINNYHYESDWGLYIMDEKTGMIGDDEKPKFSPQSINTMAQTIFFKGRNCFKEKRLNTCGNGIRESGEECDTLDTCCTSAGKPGECIHISGAECLSTDMCCTKTCKVSIKGTKCHDEDECSFTSHCNGLDQFCPLNYSDASNDNVCGKGGGLCEQGLCQKSLCYKYHLKPCFHTTKACYVHCINNKTNSCKPLLVDGKYKKLPDNWSCGNFNAGICLSGNCLVSDSSFNGDPFHPSNDDWIVISFITIISIFVCVCLALTCTFSCRRGRISRVVTV